MARLESLNGRDHAAGEAESVQVSVVVPLYDEEDNVGPMMQELLEVLDGLDTSSEVVLVDDGSRDRTAARARQWCKRDQRVRLIQFRRNFGQTAAISAGFDHARGRVIVLMDGDQQNDPGDIPRMLAKIDEGYDIVSGWRRHRQDGLLLRKLPSRAANRLISWVTGTVLHDYGCTLKAYRREVVRHLRLYGELHRFIPALSQMVGARVVEMPVNHRARARGQSKYGISRTFRVLIDLATVKFLISYSGRPMRLFGAIGSVSMAAGGAILLWLLALQALQRVGAIGGPLLTLAVLLLAGGAQLLALGMVAELVMRVHHEVGRRPAYLVRQPDDFVLLDDVDGDRAGDGHHAGNGHLVGNGHRVSNGHVVDDGHLAHIERTVDIDPETA